MGQFARTSNRVSERFSTTPICVSLKLKTLFYYRSSEDEAVEKKKKSKKNKKEKKSKKSKKKKKKSKKKSKKASSSSDSSSSDSEEGEVWLEKSDKNKLEKFSSSKLKKGQTSTAADDDALVGPAQRNTVGLSAKDFGHALLPGEGAAMVSHLSTIQIHTRIEYVH